MDDALDCPSSDRKVVAPYLPLGMIHLAKNDPLLPFTTLTWAMSLDSCIAASAGIPAILSSRASKAMTHYLRSRYDAILVGVGTAISDDPALNCRLENTTSLVENGGSHQPRPVILDPGCRWDFTNASKVIKAAHEGRGKGPYILTSAIQPPYEKQKLLERCGGKYIQVPMTLENPSVAINWKDILLVLMQQGIKSVMIEGGAKVINTLLEPKSEPLVDTVIVTIAPIWLGQEGLRVSPYKLASNKAELLNPLVALQSVRWHTMQPDMVLCGQIGS